MPRDHTIEQNMDMVQAQPLLPYLSMQPRRCATLEVSTAQPATSDVHLLSSLHSHLPTWNSETRLSRCFTKATRTLSRYPRRCRKSTPTHASLLLLKKSQLDSALLDRTRASSQSSSHLELCHALVALFHKRHQLPHIVQILAPLHAPCFAVLILHLAAHLSSAV